MAGFYGGYVGNEAGMVAGAPSFQIGPRNPFKGMGQDELNRLKEWDNKPEDLQKYYEKINQPGPRLPFALGTPGSLMAQSTTSAPGGPYSIPSPEYLRERLQGVTYPPGAGPQSQPVRQQTPGVPVQLELPLAMGNASFFYGPQYGQQLYS